MSKIKETPWQRFARDPRPLDLPESDDSLRAAFVIAEERTCSPDHVVALDGIDYEVPRALIPGRRVTIYRRLLDQSVAILHQGRLLDLHPVDLAANARAPRGRARAPEDVSSPLPMTAADMAFERDYGPVIEPDGGFPEPDPEEDPWR